MSAEFLRILQSVGFSLEKARQCADLFTANSLDGVYTHGVNRFPRFVEYIRKGYINVDAEPSCVHVAGALEQWDGNLGPGPLNAITCTDRALELADAHGLGCVSLAHTNHWMRGGAYGWLAARKGYGFIGWTNTIANTPAWGARDARLGNNPLVIAIPYRDEAVVLDMAMSQYSYGAMELYQSRKEKLPVVGGFDLRGNLTDDPSAILESQRALPIGFWKGAALSLLLDLLATVLSGGNSTSVISKSPAEYSVSQVFIAFSLQKLSHAKAIPELIARVIEDYEQSIPIDNRHSIRYPGEKALRLREENLEKGIPVQREVWKSILALGR